MIGNTAIHTPVAAEWSLRGSNRWKALQNGTTACDELGEIGLVNLVLERVALVQVIRRDRDRDVDSASPVSSEHNPEVWFQSVQTSLAIKLAVENDACICEPGQFFCSEEWAVHFDPRARVLARPNDMQPVAVPEVGRLRKFPRPYPKTESTQPDIRVAECLKRLTSHLPAQLLFHLQSLRKPKPVRRRTGEGHCSPPCCRRPRIGAFELLA